MGGGALTSYTQVWQLKGVSYADGFAALAAAEVAMVAREKYAAMPELQNLDRKHSGCENF